MNRLCLNPGRSGNNGSSLKSRRGRAWSIWLEGKANDRKLIDLYYTDEWEEIAPQGLQPLLCKCLQEAQSCIQPELWDLLHKSWFHDTYVLDLTCTQSKGVQVVRLTIEKAAAEFRKVVLEFSDVSLFQVNNNILDAKACFLALPHEMPIGQVMDIWVEKSVKLACCILLENEQSLYIRCNQMKLLQ